MKVLNKGCHIVDATATVSEQDFFNLGLGSKYGKEENGCWEKGMSKNIFPDEAAKSKLYHPDSNCLRWKFNRFVEKRSNLSIFLTPPTKSKKKYYCVKFIV